MKQLDDVSNDVPKRGDNSRGNGDQNKKLFIAVTVASCAMLIVVVAALIASFFDKGNDSKGHGQGAVSGVEATVTPSPVVTEEPAVTDAPEATDTPEATPTPEVSDGTYKVYATDIVNVRKTPSKEGEILGKLNEGDEVTAYGTEGEWVRISYNGGTAYIHGDYVTKEKPGTDPTPTSSAEGGNGSFANNSYNGEKFDLSTLDNTPVYFGYNAENLDENMIPTDWKWYSNKWNKFNVDWIQDTSKKTIYLTMDEGFGNDNTIKILQVLKEKNVKVVFFLTKYFVDERPELVKQMIDEGHQLGNHTCTHPDMTSKTIDEQTSQIMDLNDLVEEKFGYKMKMFRYPEGVYSDQSFGLVNNLGFKVVFWSYAYKDYDTANQPPVDESLKKALDRLHNGAIYLLHANSDTNTEFLADFIDGARAKGFEFGVYPS